MYPTLIESVYDDLQIAKTFSLIAFFIKLLLRKYQSNDPLISFINRNLEEHC